MGCVAFCRLRDGNKIAPRISATLYFLKFVKKLKKMQKIRVRGWKPSGLCFPCARWLGPGKVFWFLVVVVVLPGGFGLFP